MKFQNKSKNSYVYSMATTVWLFILVISMGVAWLIFYGIWILIQFIIRLFR